MLKEIFKSIKTTALKAEKELLNESKRFTRVIIKK